MHKLKSSFHIYFIFHFHSHIFHFIYIAKKWCFEAWWFIHTIFYSWRDLKKISRILSWKIGMYNMYKFFKNTYIGSHFMLLDDLLYHSLGRRHTLFPTGWPTLYFCPHNRITSWFPQLHALLSAPSCGLFFSWFVFAINFRQHLLLYF